MKKIIASAVLASGMFLFGASAMAETMVTVYGEGQYNDTELNVMLYADIDGVDADSLVSAGLSLHYDPTQLQVIDADKDEAVWYLGDPDGTVFPYFQPMDNITSYVDSITGQQMSYLPIMCGKLDSRLDRALDGVAPGTKIPLGFVTFSYPAGSDMPTVLPVLTIKGFKPDGDGSYDSFVTVGKIVLDDIAGAVVFDGVALGSEASVCLGDLNGDMAVTIRDYIIFKGEWGATGSSPADFNGDGSVNIRDYILFKSYWGSVCP